jgi:hypothetical protein
MRNLIKEMRNPDKIKPVLPLLAIILFSLYFSPVLAQSGNELIAAKKTPLTGKPITFNDLTITITPELIFNQFDNSNGSITIGFLLDWSEQPKNERIFVINDLSRFNEYVSNPKSDYNINKKVKGQLEPTFSFSPPELIQYTPEPTPWAWDQKANQFKINLITYPTVPITMTVQFFLGKFTKLKGYDIDLKAKTLTWEFSLPMKYSTDCKGRYSDYKTKLESLNPEKNKKKFEEFKEKEEEEQTKEEFDKIKEQNKQLTQLLISIKTEIKDMGCEDLQNFIDVYTEYIIPEGSLDQVGNTIKQAQKVKKVQEDVIITQSSDLEENFNKAQELYRGLARLKWELMETRSNIEEILDVKRNDLKQIKESGNSSYAGLAANQKADNNVKLMKKGFDSFCTESETLLDSLNALQKEIKSSAGADEQASGKNKHGWVRSHWYLIPSLIIIILAIVLVKYWGAIMKALAMKKKVNS